MNGLISQRCNDLTYSKESFLLIALLIFSEEVLNASKLSTNAFDYS